MLVAQILYLVMEMVLQRYQTYRWRVVRRIMLVLIFVTMSRSSCPEYPIWFDVTVYSLNHAGSDSIRISWKIFTFPLHEDLKSQKTHLFFFGHHIPLLCTRWFIRAVRRLDDFDESCYLKLGDTT